MNKTQLSGFLYLSFSVIIGLSTNRCTNTDHKIIPLKEAYKPDQPIEFPHEIHTNKGIDCKYCHNSANDGKTEGVPTANVCIKCHKQIRGDSL